MNDPYGLLASGIPPDMAAQLMGLTREQQVAQALAQQSQSPLEAPQVKGRFQGNIGAAPAIAKIVQALAGRFGLQENDKKMADLAGQVTTRRAQAMNDYQSARDGSPGQIVQPLAPNDDEGNPMPAGVKDATPGNPRAAITQALLNPLIAGNPMVAADMKKIEPNWAVHKSFDPTTGREKQIVINLNDPTQTRDFGGLKAPEMKDVTTTDAAGRPVTKFVDPHAQTAPLPQPVKMEMKDTGKVIVPVDPYAPVPLGKTTTPGEDQARTTHLQVAGLGQDGLPTGDIKDIAQAIGEYRMAPLSSFALGHPRGQAIMGEVMKSNPGYDAKDYATSQKALNDFATGRNGNTVRSLSVAVDHLNTLKQASEAMANGDIPALNRVSQYIAQQSGQPAPTTFDAMKKIVGDEIVKGIVGSGGGVADRTAAQETLSRAASPAQLNGVMDGYLKLMGGQLHGLKRQYEQTTKRKDFDRFVSEQAQDQIGAATAPAAVAAPNRALFDQADAILGGKP